MGISEYILTHQTFEALFLQHRQAPHALARTPVNLWATLVTVAETMEPMDVHIHIPCLRIALEHRQMIRRMTTIKAVCELVRDRLPCSLPVKCLKYKDDVLEPHGDDLRMADIFLRTEASGAPITCNYGPVTITVVVVALP